MLVSLHVTNFVLIDDCRIEFQLGLTVLTGETGAGKSILADALGLLVGERGSAESVREPDEDAVVEAEFALPSNGENTKIILSLLEESGIPSDDEILLIKRVLSPGGRHRIFVNNTQCLLKRLKEIGALLIDLHGQHEHQSLLDKSSYCPLLDRFGNYGKDLATYREMYRNWREAGDALRALEEDERERKRKEDMLRFQMEEIGEAGLQPGQDDEIAARLSVIQHAEKLSENCSGAVLTLSEGDGERPAIIDELDRIETSLNEMERLDPALTPILETWQTAAISLREVARDLQSYEQSLEFDPRELDRLHQRHFLIKNMKSKYGSTISEILDYHGRVTSELSRIENLDEEREKLRNRENELRKAVITQGKKIHRKRKETAREVSKQVHAELKPLGMDKAVFEIDVRYRQSSAGIDIGEAKPVAFGLDGADDIHFLVSTIPGRPPRSLREVASGGEISRIMLAIKCTFGEADAVHTMVFDEIDAGVGGNTAEAVAERLARLGECKQILCITHLPQIASRAGQNLRVDKVENEGRLSSTVTLLQGRARENELARMLGGEDSAASRRYARELLKSQKPS